MKYRVAKLLCICLVLMNCNLTFGMEILNDNSILRGECPFILSVVEEKDEYILAKIESYEISKELIVKVSVKDSENNVIENERLLSSIDKNNECMIRLDVDNQYYIEFKVYDDERIVERYRGNISTGGINVGDIIKINDIKKYIGIYHNEKRREYTEKMSITTGSAYKVESPDLVISSIEVYPDMDWYQSHFNGECYLERLDVIIEVVNIGDKTAEGFWLSALIDNRVESSSELYNIVPRSYGWTEIEFFDLNVNNPLKDLIIEVGTRGEINTDNNKEIVHLNLASYADIRTECKDVRDVEWGYKDGEKYIKRATIDVEMLNEGPAHIYGGYDIIGHQSDGKGKSKKLNVSIVNRPSYDNTFSVYNNLRSNIKKYTLILNDIDAKSEYIWLEVVPNRYFIWCESVDFIETSIFIMPEGEQFDKDNKILYQKLFNGKYMYFEYDGDGNLIKRMIK